jgi:hypothetical protein
MSPSRRVLSHTITTKTLNGLTVSLIVAVLICTLLTLTQAPATALVSDDFNDNSIDTSKWDPNNLFTSATDTNVAIAETSQQMEIGPLLQNVSGFSYRGISTVNTYNFTDSHAYVELVQAPASNTNADAIFTAGSDFNNQYRMYVSGGNLIGLRRQSAGRGAIEVTLFSISYNSTNHRFLRIRNDSGNLYMDTAPGSGGVPGTWTNQYSETWNSLIDNTAIIFELKAGTTQVEANAPGTVIWDNFDAATP